MLKVSLAKPNFPSVFAHVGVVALQRGGDTKPPGDCLTTEQLLPAWSCLVPVLLFPAKGFQLLSLRLALPCSTSLCHWNVLFMAR